MEILNWNLKKILLNLNKKWIFRTEKASELAIFPLFSFALSTKELIIFDVVVTSK